MYKRQQIYSVTDWSYEVYANRPETVTLQLTSTRLITVPIHQSVSTTMIPDDSLFLSSVERMSRNYTGYRYNFHVKPGYSIPAGGNEYHGKVTTKRVNTIVAEVFYKAMASDTLAKVADIDLTMAMFVGSDGGQGWVYVSDDLLSFSIETGITGLPSSPYEQLNLTPTDGQEGFYWLRITEGGLLL